MLYICHCEALGVHLEMRRLTNGHMIKIVSAKGRRQPKPVKPKKMIRLESKQVVFAACNSGSSAVVTKDGEVYMFGKDTSHCDHASGELLSF